MLTIPDLHRLIEKYGAYSAIPAEAWATYDAQIARARRKASEELRTEQSRFDGLKMDRAIRAAEKAGP